ncbi:MAG: SDR family oxidoreductase [Propionibacteriales bacterium]|nr:SDR family oxidoreductase [Propionibacteriales bacterium]
MVTSTRNSFDLTGSLAVVVGASQGIGAAIAEAFAGSGARLVIASRAASRLEDTRARCLEAGGEVYVGTVDVRSPASVTDLAAEVAERHGTPTILVNSAGAGARGPALELTVAEWDETQEVQLRGPFLACQAFARLMSDGGYGKIINLSSTWAATVGAERSAYCAAKAGLSHLTAALATEWAPLGIRVNALAPTATRTPSREAQWSAQPGAEDALRSRIPLGRLAEPHDLVGGALFLASRASDFVTGHTLFVDGGWHHAK